MADFNKVQIETLYLTDDGTSGGNSCLVTIPELASLSPAKRRTTIPCIGTPQVQLFANLIGELLTLQIFLLKTQEYETLIGLIDTADTNGTTLTVKIEDGELGEFDLECVLDSNPVQSGEFTDGRIPSLELRLRVVSINEEE